MGESLMGAIPVLCPSLSAWLNEPSKHAKPIGDGGPNADQLSPAEAMMSNRQVVTNLLSRAGGNMQFSEYGKFAGPFGLTLNDLFALHTATAYMHGHADANGLSETDWSEFIQTELGPQLAAIERGWREKYPEHFSEETT